MIDLCHLRIMVTRSEPQATTLCNLIEEHGGKVVRFPTIDFGPPPDQDAFQQAIAALGEQEWLIFNSPQAVYSSIAAIRRAWPHFPPHVKFAAIGAGTAKALREAGFNAEFPVTEWNSEGLLALPAFQSVMGKKIAIIRGASGREMLDKILAEREANILPVIAYERRLPDVSIDNVLSLFEQYQINAIICASFEAVKNLKLLLGETGWPFLQKCQLIVVSERIKRLAHDLGFQTIWVAHHASDAAILDVLANLRKEHDRTRNQ